MKKLLLKTMLLAAVCLFGMGQSWADVTPYSHDYEDKVIDWTTGTGDRFTPVILTEGDNHYLSVNQDQRNNNGCTLTGPNLSSYVPAGTDFTMIFDMKIASSTNQTDTEFFIKDATNSAKVFSMHETGTWTIKWTLNDDASDVVDLAGTSSNTLDKLTWYTFKITVSEGKTFLTITNTLTEVKVLDKHIIKTNSVGGGLGNMGFITSRYNANLAIDNVIIREVDSEEDLPAVNFYTMTIKFVDASSNKIKDDVEEEVAENTVYTPIYPATFDDDNNRYTYVSGADEITVSGTHTFTLVYSSEALAEYNVSFVAKAGGEAVKTLYTAKVKDGKNIYYKYPAYAFGDDNTWYRLTPSDNTNGHTASKSNVKADETVYITATAVEDGFYYVEAEDVPGAVRNTAWDGRTASGAGAAFANGQVVCTLLPGKYVITAGFGGKAGANFTLTLGENTASGSSATQFGVLSLGTLAEPIVITEATNLVATGGYQTTSSNANIWDYFFVQGEPDAVTVPMTTAGFGTFSAAYPVKIEGAKVYTLAFDGVETLTATEVKDGIVPAGEGVLVCDVAEAATASYCAEAATGDFSANSLKATTTAKEAVVELEGALVLKGNKFVTYTGTAFAANKAYLPYTVAGEAKSLTILFPEEATGVKAAEVQAQKAAGKYVVNGKLVIEKDGKKFNAAGGEL